MSSNNCIQLINQHSQQPQQQPINNSAPPSSPNHTTPITSATITNTMIISRCISPNLLPEKSSKLFQLPPTVPIATIMVVLMKVNPKEQLIDAPATQQCTAIQIVDVY
ncbi:hypothetical protein ACTFIR_004395 [Dictyostelium discoideum]